VAYQLGDSSRGVVCLLIWYSRRASESYELACGLGGAGCELPKMEWRRRYILLHVNISATMIDVYQIIIVEKPNKNAAKLTEM